MAKWTVYSDGASRGNPGPSGYGAFVTNETTGEQVGLSGYLGVTTNNVAEYEGLLAGLRHVLAHGGGTAIIRADSQLMIRQLTGQYQVKHPRLIPLFREALKLLGGLDSWQAEHVRREFNKEADRLANLGIDEHQS